MKQELQKQLHEQHAINNNEHTKSFVSFVVALLALFAGYGIVYADTDFIEVVCGCCGCNSIIEPADSKYSVDEFALMSIVTMGMLCFLSCISIIIGYAQRRDQIVVNNIRKDYGFESGYTDPKDKTFCKFIPDYYRAFYRLFLCALIFVAVVSICKLTCCFRCWHICCCNCWVCVVMIVAAVIFLLISIGTSCYYYFYKYKEKNGGKNMKVQNISDSDFVKSTPDYERYVMVHSSAFAAIFDEKVKVATNPNTLEWFVKITYKGKSVYRKCIIGRNIASDFIEMGCCTQSELGVKTGKKKVHVEPTDWFYYYWCNSDTYYKYPFVLL